MRTDRYLQIITCFTVVCLVGIVSFLLGRLSQGTSINIYVEATSSATRTLSRATTESEWVKVDEKVVFHTGVVTTTAATTTSAATATTAASSATSTLSPATSTAAVVSGKLNLNTATHAQLETLPGIGEKLAGRIIAYRNAHGGFQSVDDLDNIEGIGEKKLAELRGLVVV